MNKKHTFFLLVMTVFAIASANAQNVIGRFNYDSLNAPNVLCTYGKYRNFNQYDTSGQFQGPYSIIGIVDSGPTAYGFGFNAPASRHTVHTNILQRDSISGNLLQCIPSGKSSSVRLGCYYGAYLCQAVAYTFTVDTTLSNSLTINYSTVMYNPGHPDSQQPRLYIEILDNIGNQLGYMNIVVINPSASGNLSSLSLNWINGYQYGYYFLDWTPLCINLHQYHGRTIKLRVTTFGCGQGATNHCGYAYFTVDYSRLSIKPQPELSKSNYMTFVAPEGYMRYEWRLDSASVMICDSSRIADIPKGRTFSCKVTDYYGNTKTIRTKAAPRRPYSNFSYIVETPDCDTRILNLANLAQLFDTTDNTPLPDLEDFKWIIDTNKVCYQHDPSFEVTPGWHSVTLITSSTSTLLSDTLTQRIYVHDSIFLSDTVIYDTINAGETYTFRGRTLSTDGTYYDTIQTGNHCFDVATLHLTVVGTVGIDEADNPEIRIYPNPAVSIVNVEGGEISKVVAADNSGRTVVLPHSSSQVDVNALDSGIYTLHITTTDGKTAVRRLVKR